MRTRTKIAWAAIFVVGVSPHAMAQSIALNADASLASARDAAASASPFRLVASRQAARRTHVRPRQSRNAGLRNEGYAPWSGSQAPESGFVPRGFPENNYQYWYQACCQ
jgi:hypothetical protein